MELSSDHSGHTRALSRSSSDDLIQRRFDSTSSSESVDLQLQSTADQQSMTLSNPSSSITSSLCPLCRSCMRADEAACRRCRLTRDPEALTSDLLNQLSVPSPTTSQSNHRSEINEALTAFRFKLFAEMTPLISDLAKIVVDYLLWYRDVDDFHVGDRVDVADTRGSQSFNRSINEASTRSQDHWRWHRAVIREIDQANNQLLVGYDNYSRKWDQWIDIQSERLAPFRSMTQHLEQNLKHKMEEHKSVSSPDHDLQILKEKVEAVNLSNTQPIQ